MVDQKIAGEIAYHMEQVEMLCWRHGIQLWAHCIGRKIERGNPGLYMTVAEQKDAIPIEKWVNDNTEDE